LAAGAGAAVSAARMLSAEPASVAPLRPDAGYADTTTLAAGGQALSRGARFRTKSLLPGPAPGGVSLDVESVSSH
jgi:hypothetical protein